MAKQIMANPKIEVCGMDDRVEARQHMLDAYPSLQKMYQANDGNTEVLYLKDATVTISSFTEAPKEIKF